MKLEGPLSSIKIQLWAVNTHTHTHTHQKPKEFREKLWCTRKKKAMEYIKVELSFTEYSWTETIVTAMLSGNTESE